MADVSVKIKNKVSSQAYNDLSNTMKTWYELLKSENTGYLRNHIAGKTWENFKAIFGYTDEIMK